MHQLFGQRAKNGAGKVGQMEELRPFCNYEIQECNFPVAKGRHYGFDPAFGTRSTKFVLKQLEVDIGAENRDEGASRRFPFPQEPGG